MTQLYLLFCILIILCLTALVIDIQQYKRSTYCQVTGNSYLSTKLDAGRYGEYLTYKYLRTYEAKGAKFLFNCYLPRDNGETTEIDVLMIYKSGLYVFESKNYSGQIFGNENGKTWTQTLPQGRKSHKEHFLNPIMQNNLHIKWLKHLLQDETVPVHSVIVFSERCTLKKVDVSSKDIAVIKRDRILRTVSGIDAKAATVLAQDKVISIYEKLYPYSQTSDHVKQMHIENINNRANGQKKQKVQEKEQEKVVPFKQTEAETNVEMAPQDKEQMSCPRCGSPLVLRTAKKGEKAGQSFYGCSGFPKCRYVRDVE